MTMMVESDVRALAARELRAMRTSYRKGDMPAAHTQFAMARAFAMTTGNILSGPTYSWAVRRLYGG